MGKKARATAHAKKTQLFTTAKPKATKRTKSKSERGTKAIGSKLLYNGTQH